MVSTISLESVPKEVQYDCKRKNFMTKIMKMGDKGIMNMNPARVTIRVVEFQTNTSEKRSC